METAHAQTWAAPAITGAQFHLWLRATFRFASRKGEYAEDKNEHTMDCCCLRDVDGRHCIRGSPDHGAESAGKSTDDND